MMLFYVRDDPGISVEHGRHLADMDRRVQAKSFRAAQLEFFIILLLEEFFY